MKYNLSTSAKWEGGVFIFNDPGLAAMGIPTEAYICQRDATKILHVDSTTNTTLVIEVKDE